MQLVVGSCCSSLWVPSRCCQIDCAPDYALTVILESSPYVFPIGVVAPVGLLEPTHAPRSLDATQPGEEKSYPRPPHQRPDNVGDSPRAQARGVSVRALPRLDAFHEGHAIRINLKSGAETSLIRAAEAQRLNLPVRKSQHAANLKSIQADGRRLSVIEAATAQVEVGYQLSPPTPEASTAHEGEYHTQQLKGEYQPSPPSAEGDTQQLRGENQPSLPSAEGDTQQLKGEYQPSPPSAEGDTQQLRGENQPSLPSAEGDTQQLKGEYQSSPP
ncbi:uncharacterized protein LOC144859238 [Branchiostoma floridae x Branchiostoma japonicum]